MNVIALFSRVLVKTEVGRDLLAQDYLLKQITASLLYPEGDTGKSFWSKVYQKAFEEFGSTGHFDGYL